MTSKIDGQDHSVTLAEFTAGHLLGSYRAICGHIVDPIPVTAPFGPRCSLCAASR